MKVRVLYKDRPGNPYIYVSREAAAEAILAVFAETGENPVDEVWEEDEAEHTLDLVPIWKLMLEEA